MMVTVSPLDSRMAAKEAAAIPFPSACNKYIFRHLILSRKKKETRFK